MIIKTNSPVISSRDNITQKIAKFWDQLSPAWREVWGVHIHHGFYDGSEKVTPHEAQEKLIVNLAEKLVMTQGSHILDVGCGMGGTSLYLASHYDVNVTGITLSNAQVKIANQAAQDIHQTRVRFQIEDALSLQQFGDNTFDIVWSLESCEQFFDKALFLKNAYRVLKPGGKLLLATWCSLAEEYEGSQANDYKKLCLAFDLPYMPTMSCYQDLLVSQQFSVPFISDWSSFVEKSWDLGLSQLRQYSFWRLLQLGGWRGWRFAKQVRLMQRAFQEKRVCYGVFIGIKEKNNAMDHK